MGQRRHQRYNNPMPSFSFQLTLFNVKPHRTHNCVIIMQKWRCKNAFPRWQMKWRGEQKTFVIQKKLQTNFHFQLLISTYHTTVQPFPFSDKIIKKNIEKYFANHQYASPVIVYVNAVWYITCHSAYTLM